MNIWGDPLAELLQSEHILSKEAEFHRPLIDYLVSCKISNTSPSLDFLNEECSFAHLCQRALLLSFLGFLDQAAHLASQLLNLNAEIVHLSLWSKEDEYNEDESCFSYYLLLKACKRQESALLWYRTLNNSFLLHLERLQIEIDSISANIEALPLKKIDEPVLQIFTLSSERGSLGIMKTNHAQIRAFGPQIVPFNHPNEFGIRETVGNWSRVYSYPDVWFERKSDLSFRFVGLTVEHVLGFVFYAKAGFCKVHDEILKPKSLKRFVGQADAVVLNDLKIETTEKYKLHIIPLAGHGGFWESDFLIGFELSSVNPQISFTVSKVDPN
jgi:hypothetical protein